MNRLTIRTKARRKLDELSPKFWEDDDLNDYLDEGVKFYWQMMIDADHRGTIKTTTLNLTANTAEIALPSDYFKAKLVERVLSSGATDPLTYDDRLEDPNYISQASGDDFKPTYKFVGTNLVLESTPSFSAVGWIKLTYVFIPDEIDEDTDTPPSILGTMFPWMLVYFVVNAAKEKEETLDPGGADMGPIMRKIQMWESKFKSTIELETMQRQYVEPFSTGDCDW